MPTETGKDICADALALPHRVYQGSVLWSVTDDGVTIEGEAKPLRTIGRPKTCMSLWQLHRAHIEAAAAAYDLDVRLLIMTAAVESKGAWLAVRTEAGYRSAEETPHLVSAGLCQTLLSTAREVLDLPTLTLDRLQSPEMSLRAAAAYIARGRAETYLDPVLVAAQYNAGSVRPAHYPGNRWRLWCWRPEDGEHLERAARWYGDACFVLG